MAQFTTSIENVVISNCDIEIYGDVLKMVKWARDHFFRFAYNAPSDFRELFETKFLLTNWDKDINNYSFDFWLAQLENEVKIKAPIFAKRYSLLQDMLNSDDLFMAEKESTTENSERNTKSTGTSNNNSNSTNKSRSSSYPQNVLTQNLDDINFADSGTASESDTTARNTSTADTGENYKRGFERKRISNPVEQYSKISAELNDIITDCVNAFNNMFILVY